MLEDLEFSSSEKTGSFYFFIFFYFLIVIYCFNAIIFVGSVGEYYHKESYF